MKVSQFESFKDSIETIKVIPDCCDRNLLQQLDKVFDKPKAFSTRIPGPVSTKTYWCAQDKHHDCMWRDDKNYEQYCACECHKLNEALNRFHESQDKLIEAEIVLEPTEESERDDFSEPDETENDLATALSMLDTCVWALKGIGNCHPELPTDVEIYASRALQDAEEFLDTFDKGDK